MPSSSRRAPVRRRAFQRGITMRCLLLASVGLLGFALSGGTAAAADCVRLSYPDTNRVTFTNMCNRTIFVSYYDQGNCRNGCSTDNIGGGQTSRRSYVYQGRFTWKFVYN